jgi:tetrahydromethanopterin S-methyltransferase subunit G
MIRVQLDSRPERIDQLERQLLQLEVEATALKQVGWLVGLLVGRSVGWLIGLLTVYACGIVAFRLLTPPLPPYTHTHIPLGPRNPN